MKSKFLIVLTLILAFGMSSLYAQAPTSPSPPTLGDGFESVHQLNWTIGSPVGFSTRYLFASDADNIVNPVYYTEMNIDNWITYGTWDNPGEGPDIAAFGYGRYIGDLYLGLYYGGNLFTGYYNPAYTLTKKSDWEGGAKDFKLFAISDGAGLTASLENAGNMNRFTALIGISGMGIALSYASTLATFSEKELSFSGDSAASIDPTFYSTVKAANGWAVPQIQWGMSAPLMEAGLRPSVTVQIGIFKDFLRANPYDEGTGKSEYDSEMIYRSNNFVQPVISLDLGNFGIHMGNVFSTTVNLAYSFSTRLYKNDFNYLTTDGKISIGSIKGINDGANLHGVKYTANVITPSVTWRSDGLDRLNLAAQLELPIVLASQTTSESSDTNGTVKQNGSQFRINTTNFSPALKLGVQWEAIPNRLTLNAGGRISAVSISSIKSTYSFYLDGVAQKISGDDTETVTKITNFDLVKNYGGSVSVTGVYAGFSLRFTDNFSIEAAVTSDGSEFGVNSISVFGTTSGHLPDLSSPGSWFPATNSLTYFSRITATVKY